MPLSLEYLVSGDNAELADDAIRWTDIISLGDGSLVEAQCPRKKIIEASVAFDIGIERFVHVHAIMPYKRPNDEGGYWPCLGICNASRQDGHCLLGQKVLGKYGKGSTEHFKVPEA